MTENLIPIVSVYIKEDYGLLSPYPVKTVKDAIELVSDHMHNLAEEQAYAIFSDISLAPICIANVGIGEQSSVRLSARDVVQIAVLCNARFVTLIHNHPSYNSIPLSRGPSKEDVLVVDTIVKACDLVDVMVYDSIIATSYKTSNGDMSVPVYYSIRDHSYRRIKRGAGIKRLDDKLPNNEYDINWERTQKDRTFGKPILDPKTETKGIFFRSQKNCAKEYRNIPLMETDFVEDEAEDGVESVGKENG